MPDHTSSNSTSDGRPTSARIRSTMLCAPTGKVAKGRCPNSCADSSPDSALAPRSVPFHVCGPSLRRTSQTRSERHVRSDSLNSPYRPTPSPRGPSGTNPPSKPVAIASHTFMLRPRGQALYSSGETTPMRARRCVVACVRRGAPKSVSAEDGAHWV